MFQLRLDAVLAANNSEKLALQGNVYVDFIGNPLKDISNYDGVQIFKVCPFLVGTCHLFILWRALGSQYRIGILFLSQELRHHFPRSADVCGGHTACVRPRQYDRVLCLPHTRLRPLELTKVAELKYGHPLLMRYYY